MKRWLLLTTLVLALPVAAKPPGKPIEGKVARVVDGDTVWIEPAVGEPVLVRLQGIDAPELCQKHGPEAKQALEEMVLRQPVQALPAGEDERGRLLAKLMHGTTDVGERLVRDGQAWSYRYKDDKGPYVGQERMARALRRGLHTDPNAMQPRHFRRAQGPCPQ